jgi:hypothetical protein
VPLAPAHAVPLVHPKGEVEDEDESDLEHLDVSEAIDLVAQFASSGAGDVPPSIHLMLKHLSNQGAKSRRARIVVTLADIIFPQNSTQHLIEVDVTKSTKICATVFQWVNNNSDLRSFYIQ